MEALACVRFPCMPKVICGMEEFTVVVVVDVMTGWEVVGLETLAGIVDVVTLEFVVVVDTVEVNVCETIGWEDVV